MVPLFETCYLYFLWADFPNLLWTKLWITYAQGGEMTPDLGVEAAWGISLPARQLRRDAALSVKA